MTGFVQKLKQKWLPQFHREFFRWHCQQFFPWDRHLLPSERAYLELCFQEAENYTHEASSAHQQDSYYSYSHRVKNTEVNSARMMYGANRPSVALWQAAATVLQQRGLQLPSTVLSSLDQRVSAQISFFALGWDMQQNQCKVYFRMPSGYALTLPVWRSCWSVEMSSIRDIALGVWIFQAGQLWDERLCVFPTHAGDKEVPPGRVLLLSSRRGMMTVYDRVNVQVWAARLNPEGQRILHKYQKYSAISGSISANHANDFTLIIP